ncbi:hypothetical protein [Boudabousia liubingyangii]|uniref:hypothetical protein n=1 Tax=Boudabousia liubingyangii TaxID=1921764 RepID=UPI000AF1785B|nr:hypothetical protein [Boudabousia liubingyangii]
MTKPASHLPAILTALASTLMLASVMGVGWWVWEQAITPLLTALIWLHVIVQP